MFSPPLLRESSQAIMCPSLEVTFRSGGNSPTSRRHRECGSGQCRDPPLLPSCAGPSAGSTEIYVSKYMRLRVHTESSIRSHLHLYWAKRKLTLMPPALTHHHTDHSRLLPCFVCNQPTARSLAPPPTPLPQLLISAVQMHDFQNG